MTGANIPKQKNWEKVKLDGAIMPDGSIYQPQDNKKEEKWELRLDRIPTLY